jgi:hypothetical protein
MLIRHNFTNVNYFISSHIVYIYIYYMILWTTWWTAVYHHPSIHGPQFEKHGATTLAIKREMRYCKKAQPQVNCATLLQRGGK